MHNKKILKLLKRQEIIITLFSIIVFGIFSVCSDNFLTPTNIRLLFQQYAVNGICVLGVGIVIILGGIDLSAGSILAISGALGGTMVKMGVPIPVSILSSVVMGMACGAVNGTIVTKLGVPALIATMSTNYVFRGILVIITGGFWVNQFPKKFTTIASGRMFGLSNVFWMAMALLAFLTFVLHYTNFGRKIYAVGTNADAADKCGINSDWITICGYMVCGAAIGYAAMMYAGLYGAISTSGTGASLGTTVLAAALAGGINFNGRGTLIGGTIGMFLITIINNGLIQMRVSEYWINAVTGAIILAALILNVVNAKEKRKGEAQ
ncbi:ABC transporter permease [Clostridium sp. AM58-1XD]|uniref:ABC transporter permease n=1 Tax=Clostridium sp. AM58-1XD TaxID=2292307 RepID=UPI000E544FB8|nr:ABC transporter permease [Clostridium sp. AM58-1XD]RGZ00362.1 ABC transporter permease [Clostridium sp. AM58-1XD]